MNVKNATEVGENYVGVEVKSKPFAVSMRFPRTTRHSSRLRTRMSIFGSSY